MNCFRIAYYDPNSTAPPPPCPTLTHCQFLHGCQCDECEQLERAYHAGQIKLDESTIAEFERSMRKN